MLPSFTGNYILFTSPLLEKRHPLRWVATTLVSSNQLRMAEGQLTCTLLKHGFSSPKSPLSFHVHVTVRRDHITPWRKTEAYGTKGASAGDGWNAKAHTSSTKCISKMLACDRSSTKPQKEGRIAQRLQLPMVPGFLLKCFIVARNVTQENAHSRLLTIIVLYTMQ